MWDALLRGMAAGPPFNLWDRRDQRAERANNKEIGLTELFSAEIPHLNAMLRERDRAGGRDTLTANERDVLLTAVTECRPDFL